MNILIVKLSAIGDVIHTLPAVAALRRLYPSADITWVVEEAAADLLVGHPDLGDGARERVGEGRDEARDLVAAHDLVHHHAPVRPQHAALIRHLDARRPPPDAVDQARRPAAKEAVLARQTVAANAVVAGVDGGLGMPVKLVAHRRTVAERRDRGQGGRPTPCTLRV